MSSQNENEEDLSSFSCSLEEPKKKILLSILKQIKIGQTIKHLQLPIFVLQPRSLLEKLADSFSHLNLLLELSQIQDLESQFIQFVRWYLSGFHIGPKSVKNPLNPIIGEWFRCSWKENENCKYLAEQISHHPPHSAFCFYNVDKGVLLNGNMMPNYVKYFGNSAESALNGQFILHTFSKILGEQIFSGNYPNIYIKGIMLGSLIYELVGKVHLTSHSSDYNATIEFKKKSFLRGKYNQIEGKIKKGRKL